MSIELYKNKAKTIKKQYSYCLDDYGTLKIFINNCIHSEIADCQNMNNEEIEKLINEIIGA